MLNIIRENDNNWQTPSWQQQLKTAIRDPKELCSILEIDPQLADPWQDFKLRVPRAFVDLMQKGDQNDPLLKQILPIHLEREQIAGYSSDPLHEAQFNPSPGLLHKYANRVLLTLTGACAIHCRYCFRRHFPYDDNRLTQENLDAILHYLQQNPDINEIILSGGDPLSLADHTLFTKLNLLSQSTQIKRIRFHSRFPVVIPERITPSFIAGLSALSQTVIIVLHINHPQEISPRLMAACQQMKNVNITLLNQSVLLKGVNDDIEVLVQLSEKLFSAGILPYYLHLLDKTQGTHHFDVNLKIAKRLHQQLAARCSGYLVPKLVQEQPGASSKTTI